MANIDFKIAFILVLLFLLITFFMSFYEKVSTYKGTKAWMESHFENTFLKNKISVLLPVLVFIELIAVLALLPAIINQLCFFTEFPFARISLILCAISLLMLLFGQRIAKDYQSAAGITIYFAVVILGFFILGQ
ncbi:DoxX family protein [Zunongwangia sp.]|uniref:DoxX family protein n=1 Tax=Zunongwangia sp. TaxID=1965325 RepID=UPI003AA7E76B